MRYIPREACLIYIDQGKREWLENLVGADNCTWMSTVDADIARRRLAEYEFEGMSYGPKFMEDD